MIINKENIEERLLLLIDGELSFEEETEVMAFVEKHDEYKLLFDQFLETRLEVEIMTFEGKESLLKEEPKVLSLKKRRPYMAWAAGIAAIIGIGIVLKMMNENKVSVNDSFAVNHPVTLPKEDAINRNTVVAIQKPDLIKEKHVTSVHHPAIKQIKKQELTNPISEKIKTDDLQPLAMADYKTLNATEDNLRPVEMVASSPKVIETETDRGTGNAFVSADKLDLFNELADELESVKNNVKEKVKSIHISSLAISFGNKEYTIVK